MNNRAVARRYAQAFFEVGRERDQIAALKQDLALLTETIETQPSLRAVWLHPRISPRKKLQVMTELFEKHVSPYTLQLLRLLADKRREASLPTVYEQFCALYDQEHGIMQANVRSAVDLPEATLERLQQALSAATGKQIQLSTTVDPDLLGGLVVQIGDRRYDASIRRQLATLRRRMAGGDGEVGVSQA